MTNPRLAEYLGNLRRALRHAPGNDIETELDEVRAHLMDSIEHESQRDPSASQDEATRRAIESFGSIDEYLQSRAKPTGWRKFSWQRLSSRQRGWLVASAIALALALVLAASLGAYEAQQRRNATLLHQPIALSGFTGPLNQTFTVPSGTSGIRVSFHGMEHEAQAETGSCSNLTIRDPAGTIALQQATGCNALNTVLPNPSAGTWTIALTLTNFTGNFEMDVTTQTGEEAR